MPHSEEAIYIFTPRSGALLFGNFDHYRSIQGADYENQLRAMLKERNSPAVRHETIHPVTMSKGSSGECKSDCVMQFFCHLDDNSVSGNFAFRL